VLDYSAPLLRQTGDDLPSAGQIAGHIASSLTVEFAVKAVSPGAPSVRAPKLNVAFNGLVC